VDRERHEIGARRAARRRPYYGLELGCEGVGMWDYGLVGKLVAIAGQGDTLARHLLDAGGARCAGRLPHVRREP